MQTLLPFFILVGWKDSQSFQVQTEQDIRFCSDSCNFCGETKIGCEKEEAVMYCIVTCPGKVYFTPLTIFPHATVHVFSVLEQIFSWPTMDNWFVKEGTHAAFIRNKTLDLLVSQHSNINRFSRYNCCHSVNQYLQNKNRNRRSTTFYKCGSCNLPHSWWCGTRDLSDANWLS